MLTNAAVMAGEALPVEIINYVKPELVVVAVILYILGIFFKRAKTVPDNYIPFSLLVVSIIITALYVFSTTTISGVQETCMALFTIIVQAILLTGAAVLCSQMQIQARKQE